METISVVFLAIGGAFALYTLWLFLVGALIAASGKSVRISVWPLVLTVVFAVLFYTSL